MDDTLYNEKTYVVSGFKEVARYLNEKCEVDFHEAYSVMLESFVIDGRGNNFDAIIEKKGLDHGLALDLVKIYRGHDPDIAMKDDRKCFLKELSEKYKLCLITDGWCDVQKKKVEALGIKKYFDLVVYSQIDGVEYAKPHKKFFLKAINFFGVSHNEVLMVGDNYEKDIVGAQNLGIKTLMVENFFSTYEQEKLKKIIKEYDRN